MRGFTVGSLLGLPQGKPGSWARGPSLAIAVTANAAREAPGAAQEKKKKCCRSLCPGCPFTLAVLRGRK